jgi:hypothetical protein
MNDADNTPARGLTTEQIAAAGTTPTQADIPAPTGDQAYGDQAYGDQAYGDQAYGDQAYGDQAGGQAYGDQAGGQAYGDQAGGQAYGDQAGGQAYGDQAGEQGYGDQGYRDQGYEDDSTAPRAAADPSPRVSLLEDDELQSMTMRWKDIQAEFVDEPKEAVKEADALVAELMQRLATMFATERAELEDRWAGGNQVSTEDLRQGLRRYRSFFERLLAA